jgi:Phosphotransferase system cellobiose-specific component IIB
MRKIVLLCVAGMSTSMLVKKMIEAANEENYDCTIEAFPIADAGIVAKDADIALLGPQVRFQLKKVENEISCPILAIDMAAYGTMDGKKVIEQVKKELGD